jgi:CDP-paratose 2-epimerase
MNILVTGSSGLIGSEVVEYFCQQGNTVYGVDNNMRKTFFGENGCTNRNTKRLKEAFDDFKHLKYDIRNRAKILSLFEDIKFDAVIHTAAQPSHDLAARIPFDDFDTNAAGTLNLLEATRQHCPEAVFIHMSTNKVYGDNPNKLELIEHDKRFDYKDNTFLGVPETFSIDSCKHSLFGASKVAADILVQEYGRYFNIKTCCLRGGCLTGPNHCGVELHGFLSYLVKCNITRKQYKIFGYKGKQVRDNIHSLDVVRFMDFFIASPKIGAIYNIGGGKQNSCSILEAFDKVAGVTGRQMDYEYIDCARDGDHICYYSDLSKMKMDYKDWDITKSLDVIFLEIVNSHLKKI